MFDNAIEKDQEIVRLKVQVTALEQLLEVHEQTTLEQSDRLDQALQTLTKHAAELETVTQVSAAVSTTLETEKLLQEVVDLTKSRFNLYHTHIYLLNKAENILKLAVGAGAVGRQMVSEGWSIPLAREQSLVARAARTRQGVIVNNVRQSPDWLPNPLLPDTHSELAVPMIVGDQLLGVLDVQAAETDYFTDEDARIQTILAAQVAVALQNAARYDQTQTMLSKTEAQARRLVQLNEISTELNLATSQKDIFNIVVNRISDILATDRISLTLLRDAGDTLEIVAFEGDEVFGGIGNLIQLAGTPMETALQERYIVHSQDDSMQSVMIAPLFMGEEAIGTLNVSRFKRNAFNLDDENLLQQIASILGITIKNHRLLEQTQQRAAQLEEATNFLDSIVENIPTGIFIKDAKELKYLRINQAHADFSGLNLVDVVGTSVYDYFPKEQADFFTAKDRETMAKGELVDIPEQPMQTVKKGLRWLHTQKIPIYGADGQPKYLLGLSEDITERKQAEELLASRAAELEETTNFLNSVIENLPTMLFVKEAETLRFVRWNKAGEDLIGYPREELIGKNDYDFFPKEEADFFTAKDREVLAGGKLVDIPEEPIETAHQGTRYLHTRKIPIYGPDGEPKYLLGISEDITEQKRTEEALLHAKAQQEAILDNMPFLAWVKDKEGVFTAVNRAFAQTAGFEIEEIVGKTDYDIWPQELAAGYRQDDEEVIASRKRKHVEEPIAEPTGIRWIETIKTPIFDQNLLVVGTAGLARDITESKRLSEELREREEQFRSTLNNLPAPIVITRMTDSVVLYVNQALTELFGGTVEDLIGEKAPDFYYDPADRQKVIEGVQRDGFIRDFELQFKRTTGETFWAGFTLYPVTFFGESAFLTGFYDLTERKHIEETLRINEARSRALLNAFPDMIIRYNKEGVILDVKPPTNFEMFMPADQLIGKGLVEVMGPELAELRRQYIEQALQTDQLVTYEQQFRKNDVINYEEVSVVPAGEDEVFVVVRDIGERKRTEATLQENEARLSEALSMAQLANWEFDVPTQTFTFNDQFYSLLRTTAEQEGGYLMPAMQYAQKFVHPADAPIVGVAIQEAIETSDPNYFFQIDHRIIRADGSEGYILVRFRVVKDEQGQTVKTIGANQDITERKQAELEQERLLAEVEATYRQYIRQEWDKFLAEQHRGDWRIEYNRPEAHQEIASQSLAAIQQKALKQGQTQVVAGSPDNGFGTNPAIVTPIALRGEVLGTLSLQDINPDREWSEEEVALIEAVSEQLGLTLENLRLFDDTQRRAGREQLAREITDKMREAPEVGMIIQTGISELARVLGASRTYVKLSAPLKDSEEETAPDVDAIRAKLRQAGLNADSDPTMLSSPQNPASGFGRLEENG